MTAFSVGDIFEYHNYGDFHIAFVLPDKRIVLFNPKVNYSKICSPLTDIEQISILNNPKFKQLTVNELSDNAKSCYFQHFSTLKKRSKVEFNYRGIVISGVVVECGRLVKAKFVVDGSTIEITAEPYLFTEKL